MTTDLHVNYCVEIWANDGPTGTFREATEIAVVDFGGNELWRGKPGDEPKYQIATELAATRLGEPCASGDVLCDHDHS